MAFGKFGRYLRARKSTTLFVVFFLGYSGSSILLELLASNANISERYF